MFHTNFLKEKLESGLPVIGTWATIPSIITVDVMASSGLDFIMIDAEHGPITFETAQSMVIACESRNVSPVMRVGRIDESDILRAMDIGVHCILVPNIRSKEEVAKIVSFAKYPPIGQRGFSPFTRAGKYSIEHSKSLTEKANSNTMIAIIIEGEDAIRDIDAILEIDELDIIYIGIFDLSKALGIPGDVDNPKVLRYLEQLTLKINERGKFAATIATSESRIAQFLKIGIKYIAYLVDNEVLRSSYAEVARGFRNQK